MISSSTARSTSVRSSGAGALAVTAPSSARTCASRVAVITSVGRSAGRGGALRWWPMANRITPITTKCTGGFRIQRTLSRPQRVRHEHPEPALRGLERRPDAHRDLHHVAHAVGARETHGQRLEHEPRGAGPALTELGDLQPAEVLDPSVPERARGNRHVEDLVVVADRDVEVLRGEVVRHATRERRDEPQPVGSRRPAVLDRGPDPPERFGPIPDRRRPGALLDRLRDPRVAAEREGRGYRARVAAVDRVLVTHVGAPAAGRVLQYPDVVERALVVAPLRILTGGADGVVACFHLRSGRKFESRTVVRVTGVCDSL